MSTTPTRSQDAWDRLLRDRGELDRMPFPRLRSLVSAALEDEDRAARVGTLLDGLAPSGADGVVGTPSVHVTGFGTTAPLIAPLRAWMVRDGLQPVLTGGDFGTAMQDLADGPAEHADVLVVLLDASVVTDHLPLDWALDDIEEAVSGARELLLGAIGRASGRGLVVTSTIPLPPSLLRGLRSLADRARLSRLWRGLDVALLDAATKPNVVVLDATIVFEGAGPGEDESLRDVTGVPYAMRALDRWALHSARAVRAHAGVAHKAIVTDLDDTLWGGILGDVGADGVVSDARAGIGRQRYQRLLRQLARQGVLLAVSSKNDLDAVRTALGREDVLVDEDTFLTMEVGWDPKRHQMERILEALNIGADGVVFVDDSAFERGDVHAAHAGVTLIDSSGDASTLAVRVVRDDPFLVVRLTADDGGRVASLRSSIAARQAMASGGGFEEYLRTLDQRLTVGPMRDEDVPRVAQMTQRTNQFHLVTTRSTDEEVRRLLTAPDREVLTLRLHDRLADHGTVGAVFMKRDEDAVWVENMVLSCRVFGREVEQTVVDRLREDTVAAGVELRGAYRPSPKNGRFADFWQECGLLPAGAADDGTHFFSAPPRPVATPVSRPIEMIHEAGRLVL